MITLNSAHEAGNVVLSQFDQTARLIREIAKIEALVEKEGISDGLKDILHQEATAAYERLRVIREATDMALSRILTEDASEEPPVRVQEPTGFLAGLARDWNNTGSQVAQGLGGAVSRKLNEEESPFMRGYREGKAFRVGLTR